MDFVKIRELAKHIPDKNGMIINEDVAKLALIQPFISALGYDLTDPKEVMPEYPIVRGKDFADYAIISDKVPIILIECKRSGKTISDLDVHQSQLKRYFDLSSAKFGILTNGIIYKFYASLDETNKMDEDPFLELDLLNINDPIENDPALIEVKSFAKPMDIDNARERALLLKNIKKIRTIIEEPSEEFVKFIARQVRGGYVSEKVLKEFTELIKVALKQYIDDGIKDAKPIHFSTGPGKSTGDRIGIETETVNEDLKSFIFEDQIIKIELWKDMLPKVCAIMAERYKNDFEKILEVKGRKYNYFSKDPNEFKYGERIVGTDIYVNTNAGPWDHLHRSRKVIAKFGLLKEAIQWKR